MSDSTLWAAAYQALLSMGFSRRVLEWGAIAFFILEKSRVQLLVSPERMKLLDPSENDTQLWICLVVKVKFDAVKNNIA